MTTLALKVSDLSHDRRHAREKHRDGPVGVEPALGWPGRHGAINGHAFF